MPTIPASPAPVLIVGAGPTGLTLAACLNRYGVRVRVVERKPRLSVHTKATNLMQRSQEVISALGLLDPVAAVGHQMRRLMVHAYGKSLGPRTMHFAGTPFPNVLLCGQHNLEAGLADGIARRGVRVEFGTSLTGLTQTADSAAVTLTGPTGVERTEFAYVVGCDGHAGATRSFTPLDFTPRRAGVALRQVDCKLTWRRLSTPDQMWLFYFDKGFAAVFPLPGGVHRVLTCEPRAAVPDRDPTLDEMQTKLREIAADPSLTLTDPDWFSQTDLAMGIAPGLRHGRVVLAGDAGNPILPNGGQGMNTGIGDAFNLGWKLAAVVRDGAADALLDTYAAERHALRVGLEKAQFNSLKYTTLVTPGWMRAAFRLFAEPLLNCGGEAFMARTFSQLDIHTRKSPLTLDAAGRRGLRAGDRALNADVAGPGGTVRLYDLVYAGGWTVLAFAGTRPGGTAAVAAALAAIGRPDVPTYLVTPDPAADTNFDTLYDADEVAHRVYGVTRPTVYLVRPDGHVGARVTPADAGRLAEYAAKWVSGGGLAPSVAARPAAAAAA